VGKPSKRFEEDALRMMRALRFSAQLGFDIEKTTFEDLCADADLIKNISIERIRDEFSKLILSSHCERLDLLLISGMQKHFLPELTRIIEESDKQKFYDCLNTLPSDIVLRLAFIFKDTDPKKVTEILKRLRFDNKTISKTAEIVKYADYEITDEYTAGKLLSLTDYSAEIFEIQTKICKYYEISNENIEIARKICNNISSNCHRTAQLAVKGADIMALGFTGKQIGSALALALDYVLRYPQKNTKSDILNFLKEMNSNEEQN
jgi:tRNA nucleotidyltransferase (CCA-adding enzyme)